MNVEALTQGGVNVASGLNRFCGDEELFESCLKDFISDPCYDELIAALDAGDTQTAFERAHTLKGVVGTLSMEDFFNAVSPLVEALRNDQGPDAVAAGRADTEREYARVMESLKTAL